MGADLRSGGPERRADVPVACAVMCIPVDIKHFPATSRRHLGLEEASPCIPHRDLQIDESGSWQTRAAVSSRPWDRSTRRNISRTNEKDATSLPIFSRIGQQEIPAIVDHSSASSSRRSPHPSPSPLPFITDGQGHDRSLSWIGVDSWHSRSATSSREPGNYVGGTRLV